MTTKTNAAVEKIRAAYEKVKRAVVLDAHARVVSATPIDTGRARGNWNLGIGGPDRSQLPPGKYSAMPSPPSAIGRVVLGVDAFLSNNLPYIVRLNEGSSKQAPAKYVERAIAETRAAFKGIVMAARRKA